MKENFRKLLLECRFSEILVLLKEHNQCLSLDWIANFKEDVPPEKIYSFLTYVLAQEDSANNRILLCHYLMFMNEFFDDIYTVVKYHVLRPAHTREEQQELYEWTLFNFDDGHPDSPFSDEELNQMKQWLNNDQHELNE